MSDDRQYKVRAVHCDHRASDEEVYRALKRATEPLTETWDRLAKAKRIGIKFNQDKEVKNWIFFEDTLQQLVSAKVVRAVLRLLRERTDAEIIHTDVSFYTMYHGADPDGHPDRDALLQGIRHQARRRHQAALSHGQRTRRRADVPANTCCPKPRWTWTSSFPSAR